MTLIPSALRLLLAQDHLEEWLVKCLVVLCAVEGHCVGGGGSEDGGSEDGASPKGWQRCGPAKDMPKRGRQARNVSGRHCARIPMLNPVRTTYQTCLKCPVLVDLVYFEPHDLQLHVLGLEL